MSATRSRSRPLADGVDVLTLTASPIPRTLEMALTGIRDLSMVNTPPAARRPILTHVGEFEEAGGVRGHPPRAAPRGSGLLRPQPGAGHRRGGASGCGRMAPEARVAVAHGQMDEGTLEKVVLDFWEGGLRRAGVHHHHRVGHRHAHRQHPGGRPGRPARSGPAPPAARPGGPGRSAGLRLPVPPGRPGPLRAGLRAAAHHRRPHRARARGSRSPCATCRSGGRATCSAGTSPATSPPSATTSTSRWSPRRCPS